MKIYKKTIRVTDYYELFDGDEEKIYNDMISSSSIREKDIFQVDKIRKGSDGQFGVSDKYIFKIYTKEPKQ